MLVMTVSALDSMQIGREQSNSKEGNQREINIEEKDRMKEGEVTWQRNLSCDQYVEIFLEQ